MADAHDTHVDHGEVFRAYVAVFGALCVFTLVSFLVNAVMHGTFAGVSIIMAVAVVKATLVAMIFMHLKWDWTKLYFIILPLMILTVMLIVVLLPDIVLTWVD